MDKILTIIIPITISAIIFDFLIVPNTEKVEELK